MARKQRSDIAGAQPRPEEAVPGGEHRDEKYQYEEFTVVSNRWGWALLIACSIALMTWGMANHMFIRERPDTWNYGAGPQAPGESIYTTLEPTDQQNEHPPLQMPRLPEAESSVPPPPEKNNGGAQGPSGQEATP